MQRVSTGLLEVAYEESGPAEGPVILLHGWPDAPGGSGEAQWRGYRTIAACLRGFGETKFMDAKTPRVAQPPTLMLHGALDSCAGVEPSKGAEEFFMGGYRREVIEVAGRFVQREAPDAVAAALLQHLAAHP